MPNQARKSYFRQFVESVERPPGEKDPEDVAERALGWVREVFMGMRNTIPTHPIGELEFGDTTLHGVFTAALRLEDADKISYQHTRGVYFDYGRVSGADRLEGGWLRDYIWGIGRSGHWVIMSFEYKLPSVANDHTWDVRNLDLRDSATTSQMIEWLTPAGAIEVVFGEMRKLFKGVAERRRALLAEAEEASLAVEHASNLLL